MTLQDYSVATEFADFRASAWRTIPRRFSREKNSTFYYFDYDARQRKFVELRLDKKETNTNLERTKKNKNIETTWKIKILKLVQKQFGA